MPTGGIAPAEGTEGCGYLKHRIVILLTWLVEEAHALLIRAGFVRQVSAKSNIESVSVVLANLHRRMLASFSFFLWDYEFKRK